MFVTRVASTLCCIVMVLPVVYAKYKGKRDTLAEPASEGFGGNSERVKVCGSRCQCGDDALGFGPLLLQVDSTRTPPAFVTQRTLAKQSYHPIYIRLKPTRYTTHS